MMLTHICPKCGKEHECDSTPEPDKLCPNCSNDRAVVVGGKPEWDYCVEGVIQKCEKCENKLRLSSAMVKRIENIKNKIIVCPDCGNKLMQEDDDVKIVPPNLEQIKEIRTKFPDFGEYEIRRIIDIIKSEKRVE
jgi:DNA-directed RNA polymerase subunit RPC12/RpoP